MTEEQLQSQCYQWFHNTLHQHRGMLFHVDNNSWNAVIGSKKKALGVNPGVSDFVFISFLGKVLWIEMKTEVGSQSEEQRKFQLQVTLRGHEYYVCRSFKEFQMIILTEVNRVNYDQQQS